MYTNLLSQQDREHILDKLRLFATDEILTAALDETFRGRRQLLELFQQIKKEHVPTTKTDTKVIQRVVGAHPDLATAYGKEADVKTVHEGPAAVLVDSIKNGPPGEPAGRIAESTKKIIFDILNKGPANTAEINEKLNGSLSNTGRILKLLWVRKQVVYINGIFHKE